MVAGIEELLALTEEDIARLPVDEIKTHIGALDREFAGRRMDKEAKALWNSLNGAADEFVMREERIRELAGKGQVESSIDSFQTRRPARRTVTHVDRRMRLYEMIRQERTRGR